MQPSMTGVGKTIRMNRIFKDGKAVMVAVNHGISLGPIDGINHLEQLFSKVLARKPDSLTIHKGIAMRFCDMLPAETSLLLKVTNASLYFSPEEMDIATVHEAALLGADAIAIGVSAVLGNPMKFSGRPEWCRRQKPSACRPLRTAIPVAPI